MSDTAPKPGSWIEPKPEKKTRNRKNEKKPFVLKPHLTNRPLKTDPKLQSLLDQLKK